MTIGGGGIQLNGTIRILAASELQWSSSLSCRPTVAQVRPDLLVLNTSTKLDNVTAHSSLNFNSRELKLDIPPSIHGFTFVSKKTGKSNTSNPVSERGQNLTPSRAARNWSSDLIRGVIKEMAFTSLIESVETGQVCKYYHSNEKLLAIILVPLMFTSEVLNVAEKPILCTWWTRNLGFWMSRD